MAQTKTEKVIAYLLAKGSVELPSRSAKYRTFTRFDRQSDKLYFVGKAGALRTGTCVSNSISVTGIHAKNF